LSGDDQPRVVVLDGLGHPLSFASEGWMHFGNGPRADPLPQ